MNKIEFGDCREIMSRWKDEGVKVQTCVTSPPYFGLRDYGVDGQIGLEQTVGEYVANMVDVFRHVWHILEDNGTVVSAHSNQLRDGKGTGIKGHDYRIAFLCHQCHHMIDNDKMLDKHDRIAAWEEAHRKTIGWLFNNGHLEVK